MPTRWRGPAPTSPSSTGRRRPSSAARIRSRAPACASPGPESFTWWKERLNEAGVKTGEIAERDGRLTLDFEDPEGQRLSA